MTLMNHSLKSRAEQTSKVFLKQFIFEMSLLFEMEAKFGQMWLNTQKIQLAIKKVREKRDEKIRMLKEFFDNEKYYIVKYYTFKKQKKSSKNLIAGL